MRRPVAQYSNKVPAQCKIPKGPVVEQLACENSIHVDDVVDFTRRARAVAEADKKGRKLYEQKKHDEALEASQAPMTSW